MSFVKLMVILCLASIARCDLSDLCVEHTDEATRTLADETRQRQHPRDLADKFGSKRRVFGEELRFQIGPLKKQKLRVDDDHWRTSKMRKEKKRPIEEPDGPNYSNDRKAHLDPSQHEFIERLLKNSTRIESTLANDFEEDKSRQSYESNEQDPELDAFADDERLGSAIVDASMPRASKNRDNSSKASPKKYNSSSEKSPRKRMSGGPSESSKPRRVLESSSGRARRSVKRANFTRREVLDDDADDDDGDGDVVLEWDPTDDEIVTFRVTAKTLGYVGIGFNDKSHMKGADILITWVDDHTGAPTVLDSHGTEEANASPITDLSQDVDIIEGSQNGTHTTVTFSRRWRTCDPEDRPLSADNVRVLWAMHESDPELNTAVWHGEKRGGRALRLRSPGPRPSPPVTPDVRHWDVKLNRFAVTDTQDTVYWCKIFKAPALAGKHHMIGYEPLVEESNRGLVHHMILYECASTLPILGQHARIAGARCYSSTMPREWDSCIQPVVAWARGSRGEWLPRDVGIPIAEHSEGSYYMLEVHYNNPGLQSAIDSSGVRLRLTPNLRANEAGILVTGVSVGPLHLIPPRQREYATAGYCASSCTDTLFPNDGVSAVSVVLHAHLAGRRMSLKHIRNRTELPRIVEENRFDFDYQQSHTLEKEVRIMPGDELVTECVYGTEDRARPTLGGFAATQEMCLAFVLYYPRTELAGCYSITPAKDLFTTLGVESFKGVGMDRLEKLFLTTGTDAVAPPASPRQRLAAGNAEFVPNDEIDVDVLREAESALRAMRDSTEDRDSDNVFARLIIEDPKEFRGRTLAEHMLALPWSEELLARSIESNLYHGRHMTFCRKRNDKLALPADIQTFPNFTALPEATDDEETSCTDNGQTSASASALTRRAWLNHLVVVSLIVPLL